MYWSFWGDWSFQFIFLHRFYDWMNTIFLYCGIVRVLEFHLFVIYWTYAKKEIFILLTKWYCVKAFHYLFLLTVTSYNNKHIKYITSSAWLIYYNLFCAFGLHLFWFGHLMNNTYLPGNISWTTESSKIICEAGKVSSRKKGFFHDFEERSEEIWYFRKIDPKYILAKIFRGLTVYWIYFVYFEFDRCPFWKKANYQIDDTKKLQRWYWTWEKLIWSN